MKFGTREVSTLEIFASLGTIEVYNIMALFKSSATQWAEFFKAREMASTKDEIDEVVLELKAILDGNGDMTKRQEIQVTTLQARELSLRAQLLAETNQGEF
jgi:hypothetical protein